MNDWRAAFALQAQACRTLGAPLTADLCERLAKAIAADPGPVAGRVREWSGDPTYHGDSVPLRLTGALQGLVLTGALAAATQDIDLSRVFQQHEAWFLDWLDRPPQTNEVGRSAVLIAACRFLAGLGHRDLDLLELGASAGLNLNFPLYHLDLETNEPGVVVLTPEWRGTPPPALPLQFGSARGVDLNPLDPVRDRLRLLAYIWPDQPQRLARTRAALDLARQHPPQVDQGDAGAWLQAQLAAAAPRGRLVYHTVAAQYFPPRTRAQVEHALRTAGADTRPGAPLCHVSMEADGGEGMALHLRLWDSGRLSRWDLGRAHAHAQWIAWTPAECQPEESA